MKLIDLQNVILLFSFLHTFSINILTFGDPKNISSDLLKIGNISDDTYEKYLGPQNITFPIGRDWSICYRWFIDQIRFTDPGMIYIHLREGFKKKNVKFGLLAEPPLTPPPPPNLGPVIRSIFFIVLFKSTPFKT